MRPHQCYFWHGKCTDCIAEKAWNRLRDPHYYDLVETSPQSPLGNDNLLIKDFTLSSREMESIHHKFKSNANRT